MAHLDTNQIEKRVLISAPRSRVWRALTDAGEFGTWFGVNLAGTFAPGARLSGHITIKGYEHLVLEVTIETMEPERLLSWRWHPNAVEAGRDYSSEPTTLVCFELEEAEGGTLLTVVESGFDKIPLARREEAYLGNQGGWAFQMESIKRFVDDTP